LINHGRIWKDLIRLVKLIAIPAAVSFLGRVWFTSHRNLACCSDAGSRWQGLARLIAEIVWLPAQPTPNNFFSSAHSSRQLVSALHEPGSVETLESYISCEPGSSGTVA